MRPVFLSPLSFGPALLGLALLAFSAPAFAQMGGGMGGGGMGGGMGGGGMGGGMGGGGRHGGMRGGMGSPGGMGQRSFRDMKPIARDKMDKPVEEMFRAADTDKDGTVTFDELKAVLDGRRDAIIRQRFKTVDANGDKMIDEKEFVAWQNGMGTVALSDTDSRGSFAGVVTDSLPPSLGKDEEDRALRWIIEPLSVNVLVSANTNYDKGMTLAELLAYEHKRFDGADTDKDGKLSAEEMRGLEGGGTGPRGRMMRPAGEGAGTAAPPPQPSPDDAPSD